MPAVATLRAPLPVELEWLTPDVAALVRPAAFALQSPNAKAPLGGTFTAGHPDIPVNASWAAAAQSSSWLRSPYDGESFWLQLNLEDIPLEVRNPQWPGHGVVWLTLDTSGPWQARTYFDPRPASSIEWQARNPLCSQPTAVSFKIVDTLPSASDETLPQISWDWSTGGFCEQYDDWVSEHFLRRRPSDLQVGGWVWPCQGDQDVVNKTIVLEFSRQEFGDSGSLELHYTPARGFWAAAHTH